jgi:hypothetical protein
MLEGYYLIIKAIPLSDQWETDADRKPVCITTNTDPYEGEKYEIYQIKSDGTLEQIKEYWEDYT